MNKTIKKATKKQAPIKVVEKQRSLHTEHLSLISLLKNAELDNKYGISYGYEKIDSEFLSWLELKNKEELLEKVKNKDDVIIYGTKIIGRDFIKYEYRILYPGFSQFLVCMGKYYDYSNKFTF